MAKKSPKTRLSEHIRHLLSGYATPEIMREVAPELLSKLKPGMSMPLLSELLAQKVISLALDKDRPNQWAIEMVFDRSEGKSVQGIPLREDGRVTEGKLDEYTIHHLNAISAGFAAGIEGDQEVSQTPADGALGSTPGKLDLSSNRVGCSEGDNDKPEVAESPSRPSQPG